MDIIKSAAGLYLRFPGIVTTPYVSRFSTREINKQPEEFHGAEVSPTLISNVTDALMETNGHGSRVLLRRSILPDIH